MNRAPRILFLSQCLPYPPDSGVTSRTFNVLRQLSREFEVVVLPYFRRNHQASPEALSEARRDLARHGIDVRPPQPILAEHRLARRVWDHARSVVTRKAYTFYEYEHGGYRAQLRGALAERRPALVHLDSLVLERWVTELPGVPLAVTHHNIESDVLGRRAAHAPSRVLGLYIRHQAALVEASERRLAGRFRLNVMMSELDAERLRALAPGARTVVVPNGVDTEFLQPAPQPPVVPGRVVFLGPTYLFPNRDGMDFFLAEIWPRVRAALPSASLRLVGATPVDHQERYERVAGVRCLGRVPDIRPHLLAAGCCIVPLRVGGGTRLKILDAWALGKAVVSTSLGCEGLNAEDGIHLLIRDDPRAFAASVVDVLSRPDLRAGLEGAARRIAEERYSWDQIGERLRAAYRGIMAPSRGPAASTPAAVPQPR